MSEAEATPINPRAELEALQQRTLAACNAELDQVLKAHGCTLQAVPRFVHSEGGFKIAAEVQLAIAR